MCAPKPKRQLPTFAVSSSYSRPHWLNSDRSAYESLANETLNELIGALNGLFSIVTDDHSNPIGVSTRESQDGNDHCYSEAN
ncbi:hypothetical protein Bpfe_017864 [Biomphalaria pfeifferi]|uniref:Uncharacterized protein n=1 Tax=Biomphalaria pfeifferi TaxID=112525 RepID=A0AAD8BEX5_BIOPF|nr:hypothetical protein Bpfe_017864 [Biomphalaria pfeifferi]